MNSALLPILFPCPPCPGMVAARSSACSALTVQQVKINSTSGCRQDSCWLPRR
ncbi:MAG: hypothetical protein ACLTMP_14615 [Eggerthella lenta]